MQKNRKLQIERRWRAGKWKTVTPVAQILLKGKWLEQAGFEAGHQVDVEVCQGQLVLRAIGLSVLAG
ncbi:SymE family type I addiction module toxin [Hymenobacter terricola]|uniref:SymE family type I addiction module toxin n=1 Tax=Hymenobacter terricola TaxID=2819236 RepID=UPI001B310083|nr:SymE family type I addiction module toxin [Hymenobacter terricola]